MRDSASPVASRRDKIFAMVAMGAFFLSLVFGMILPIYTDEIGWRFQERAGIDGVDITVNDLCGPTSIALAPWFMMPVRWFQATVNLAFADPLYVRMMGVGCAVVWGLLLLVLTGMLEKDSKRRASTQALAFGLLGLGSLPLLMVMSRPELPLILCTLLAILVALVKSPERAPVLGAWLKVAIILLLTVIGESFHLKGVLYAPIALICILICAKGRATLLPRAIGVVAILGVTLVAAHYWVERFKCPGDALLASVMAKQSVASLLTGRQPGLDLLPKLIAGANPINYVILTKLTNFPMSSWVPDNLFSAIPKKAVTAANAALLAMWLAAIILACISFVRLLLREGLKGLFAPRPLLALSVLACILVWGASQLRLGVYEASHILPMLVIFLLLCLSLRRADATGPDRGLSLVSRMIVVVSVVIQAIVIGYTAGPLIAATRAPGYIDNQPFSVSIGHYDEVRKDIGKAMADSGIPANRRLKRLLVDDVTYFVLQDSYLPLYRLGVLSHWNGSITDPVAYLHSRQSDGAVVGCRYLPDNMRAAASRSGNVCALSRATIDRLAAQPAASNR